MGLRRAIGRLGNWVIVRRFSNLPIAQLPSSLWAPILHHSTTPLLRASLLALALLLAASASGRQGARSFPPVWSLAYSPDGRFLAVGSYRTVAIWEPGALALGARAPLRRL